MKQQCKNEGCNNPAYSFGGTQYTLCKPCLQKANGEKREGGMSMSDFVAVDRYETAAKLINDNIMTRAHMKRLVALVEKRSGAYRQQALDVAAARMEL